MVVRPNLVPNGERLWATLMASAEIGKGDAGGLRRLTLTDDDKRMRDLFADWARDGGWSLAVDKLGNMFVRRDGTDPSLPPVVMGSHLDTQAKGGRFDGILGVLSGLEVLRTLDERGIATKRPIEVVDWTNEEGARFYPAIMSSRVFCGGETVDWALAREDKAGVRFGDALARIGYDGPAPVGGRTLDSYFELHIEQGPKLDAAGLPVGIVTGGFAQRGMKIEIRGSTAHVGPTPMARRRNALVGAAFAIAAIDETGWRYAHEEGKTSAARLDLRPNLPGILSDEADLFIDFRHPVKARIADMERDIEAAMPEAARRSQCDIRIAERFGFGGLAFDAELIGLLRETAARLGYPTMDLMSEAGHDAYNLNAYCPTCMIFTPCKDGISHNEAEDIALAQTLPGVTVLLHAVIARANR